LNEWTVPGYTELKPLGSGGFGSVVLARHDATGTAVAVKYLRPALRQDPEFAALFRAEAEALGALDDPHVVRLYEYVESAAGAAIVMELVDGVTLWDILSQHGRTTPEAALVVLYGSLLGLAAAHARGVVHRDFKPRNVLVNAYGASKLTDFGIAARAGTPTIPSGSVAYAPPEQFDGGPASPASDVYAATATFYECLAGRPPFTGPTIDAVIWQHHSAEVPMDPVPAPLQPIVARGMAKDPGYRPADAAALATGLRAAATNAYGPDWEQRGRYHLGEAALVLAALWPSAGVPALHVSSMEQVSLSHRAQHAHSAQAAHHPATKAALHRWHLRHVLHLDHVARTAVVTVTTAAVVAAAVTVAATSRAPGGPGGTPAHPAVAAYQAPLAAAIPATLTSNSKPVDGDTYVKYDPGGANTDPAAATAKLGGEITHATIGEVVRLYAQQFPFTNAPAPVESIALNPVGGTATYSFTVTPALATRYQVTLLRSATATTPVASSASRTVYVTSSSQLPFYGNYHGTLCLSRPACRAAANFIIYFPSSALQTEMSKRKYLYLAFSLTPSGTVPPPLTSLPLDANGTISKLQRIVDNAYSISISFTYNVGNSPIANSSVDFGFCTEQTEAQDGIGLPGPSACGASSIPASAYYLFSSGGSSVG
jgi:serine/threonine-protein kinase